MKQEILTSANLVKYGFLAAPVAFAGFPLYVLAPDFYATHYGLTLSSLGLALLFLRLFDAFQDPLIGAISDRYRNKTNPILITSAVILVFSIYALFSFSYFSPLIWFALCMGLAVTAYSVLSINLNALGALWTDDRDAQTCIAASREAFGLLGLVIAVSLPGLLSNIVPKEQIYHLFSLTLALIMAAALLLFLRWHRITLNTSPASKAQGSIFLSLKSLSSDSRKLLLVYLASMVASSIPAVLVIFFVRDLLGAESYTGLFLLLYFLSGVFFMPLWKRISQTVGKHRSWFFSMLLASVSFVWAFFLGQGDIWQYAAICIASGAALSADLVFPPAILADQLHASKAEHHASTHYATLTLTAKASLALASAVSLPALESFGFTPNIQNSAAALQGLSISYALVPCVLKIGAALLLWRMFIHSKKGVAHENNQINRHSGSHHHA